MKTVSMAKAHERDRKKGPAALLHWVASMLTLSTIAFSTLVNFYYALHYDNVVTTTFIDLYTAEKEWLFDVEHTAPLDVGLVYAFLNSTDPKDSLNLVEAFRTSPITQITSTTECVAQVAEDDGSLYAFCDRLDHSRLPDWAKGFEALIIQTAYLSTREALHSPTHPASVGAFEAFTSERNGWYQQGTIDRMVCTTPRIARPTPAFVPRTLYTNAHGILTSVDCTLASEQLTLACRLTLDNPQTELFDDGTGNMPVIAKYEVFRTTKGVDMILTPYSTRDRIGERTIAELAWPVDDCLYTRGEAIGWFGVGGVVYTVNIPYIALVAKLELIGVVGLIWLVKYHCRLNRIHEALFQTSRLGVFTILVAQIAISAYYEQDIMRSIHSWPRFSAVEWLLWLYIESTIAMTVSLMALLLVRFWFESSISEWGCMLSIAVAIPAAFAELVIANIHYSVYSEENGLKTSPDGCKSGYLGFTGCTQPKFNFLFLVVLLALFPVMVELGKTAHRRMKRAKRRTNGIPVVNVGQESTALTSFERVCLDGIPATQVVWDVHSAYVGSDKGVRLTSAAVITASGFTLIQDRFLIRTKDLALLLFASIAPASCLREVSTVVWPVQLNDQGELYVHGTRRVFLHGLRNLAVPGKEMASLINAVERDLV